MYPSQSSNHSSPLWIKSNKNILQKLSQEEFSKLAVDGAEVDDLLIGEVGVKDFGDNENEDIAERFGAKKEDFPGF